MKKCGVPFFPPFLLRCLLICGLRLPYWNVPNIHNSSPCSIFFLRCSLKIFLIFCPSKLPLCNTYLAWKLPNILQLHLNPHHFNLLPKREGYLLLYYMSLFLILPNNLPRMTMSLTSVIPIMWISIIFKISLIWCLSFCLSSSYTNYSCELLLYLSLYSTFNACFIFSCHVLLLLTFLLCSCNFINSILGI